MLDRRFASILVAAASMTPSAIASGQAPPKLHGAALDSARGIPPIRDVDTSFHLSGNASFRFPSDPDFIERARVLIHGETVGRGCRFHSYGLFPDHAERDVEIDYTNCLAIRARGEFRLPRP